MSKRWDQLLSTNDHTDLLWELFHINSRCSEYESAPKITHNNQPLREATFLNYSNFPAIPLPTKQPLEMRLSEAINERTSASKMISASMNLEEIATLLSSSYAVSDPHAHTSFQTRSAPSAGALYPIELYFHYSPSKDHQQTLLPGLYYYNPVKTELRQLMNKNCKTEIQPMFMQPHLLENATLQIFITAIFPRSTQKYGDRGYRFSFLEAGHIAQNINLVASAMKLSCINIGGYYERKINEFLKIDGVSHSTIYTMLIGKRGN